MKWIEAKAQNHSILAGVGSKVLKYVDQGLFKKNPYKNVMSIELGLVLALDHSPTNLESNKLNVTNQPKNKTINGSNQSSHLLFIYLWNLWPIIWSEGVNINFSILSIQLNFGIGYFHTSYLCVIRMINSPKKYGTNQCTIIVGWSEPWLRIVKS